jgi:hypothetical protein
MFLSAAIFIASACLFYGCPKTYEYFIDQETKDYCLFGENSYWIFQDSATLRIDSIVIDNPILYELQEGKGYSKSFIESYVTLISSYSQGNVISVMAGLSTGYRCDYSPLSVCYLVFDVAYHNGKINEICYYQRNCVLFDEIENCLLDESCYSNVKIFINRDSEKSYKLFYWAKNVGLIRTEIYGNDSVVVKNLIRYNVKPYKN